ncbi:MAG: hypothetical protein EOP50_18865, partial [Sphingobacteriales bacterium]
MTATVAYDADWLCVSGSRNATVSIPGGTFTASPAGLLIDAATGIVTGGTAGRYAVTYSVEIGCAAPATAITTFDVKAPLGDPSVFGAGVWNVYAWNSGSTTVPNSNTWSANYAGYLTAATLDFNSTNYWSSTSTPSSAAGFNGCNVPQLQFSWSAKRVGFPCDRYQISIPTHRFTGQLWINGLMVWEHIGSGDYHGNVWTGRLGQSDSVEFRCLNSGGSGFGSIAFTPLGYAVDMSYPFANSCSGSAPIAASVNYSGGVFRSAPAGLALDTATGTVTPSSSSTGNYTIYYTWTSPCGDTQVDSAQLSIGAQQGDPSLFGTDQWTVHVWNSGGASITSDAWSANYSGSYNATGINFSSLTYVGDGAPPSD